MKVLVVSSWLPYPPSNGSKLRAYHLLESLVERHRTSLLSFAEPGEECDVPALNAMCRTVRTVAGNPFKPGRLAARRLLSSVPRSFAQTYSPVMQRLVDEALPAHDVAVGLQLGAALYLAHRPGIPRVFEEVEVGVIQDQYLRQPWGFRRARHGLTWFKFSRFIRELVGRFERTTVVSGIEHGRLGEIGCDRARIRVVPNGVDRNDLDRPKRPEPGRLIYPGSVTYAANLGAVQYFARDILPLVRAARPEAWLAVTGAVGDVDVAGLANMAGVAFTGHLADVKHAVASSAVCVVPLRIGGGTRLKILEAMALGTPVVATSKGAEGLAVTPERDILIADRPNDFAAAVLRVLNDPALAARLGANGRSLVERLYTWDRIGAKLDAVLDEAVAASHPLRPIGSSAQGARRAAGA